MAHAWLDSLSEDWVSQPASDASQSPAAQSVAAPSEAIENVKPSNHARTPGSRIPRPVHLGKDTNATTTHDNSLNSVNVLSERSLNDINIPVSYRGPSKLSQEVKFAGQQTDQLNRAVSAASTGSVVHNTVQHHKSPGASPLRNKGQTPEWKRRLIYGDLAYGEQKDLFCSAANGLENIFRPPQPQEPSMTEMVDGQNSTTLPSSPPPYCLRRPTFEEDSEEELEELEVPDPDSPSPRRAPRQMTYRMAEDFADGSENSEFSIRPGSGRLSQWDNQVQGDGSSQMESVNRLAPAQTETRKTSAQSVIRNEDFSPIIMTKHSSDDGRVNFAPMEIPADLLRQRLERLRVDQRLLDSQTNLALSDEYAAEESQNLEDTDDYARNGGFLNVRRGGRSAEGSFRHRLLSPGLGTDTSEMLPEESLQASTPKQFPTFRVEAPKSPVRIVSRSPAIPAAPYPSPEKKMSENTNSAHSPLKLFGPYDTFTNQTLMRRISQFEEQMDSSRPSLVGQRDGSYQSDANDVFTTQSNHRKGSQTPPPAIRQSRSVSQFGAGDLEGYQFSNDMSHLSNQNPELESDEEAYDDSEGSQPEFKFDMSHSASPKDDEEPLMSRKRQKSATAFSSSRHTRTASRGSQYSLKENPVATRPGAERPKTPRKRDSGSEGKRPRTSPSKDPTPKRRRTLHKSDIAYGRDDQLLLDSAQNLGLQMQSAMGKKRKDARPGDLQQLANPNVLAARQILRPRTPTPSQRSSLQREEHPFADPPALQTERLNKRSPIRGSHFAGASNKSNPAATPSDVNSETERKPSIRTQDFLDEAGKIMAMIRSQVKPPSGLTSVEESEMENGATPGMSGSPDTADDDDSFQDSTREPFSRPPSREGGRPVSRMPPRQEDPEIVDRLKKYEELSDMGDIISSSIRSMSLAKNAIRAAQEVERQVRETTRSRESLRDVQEDEVFSDPPNIRISENPARQDHSSGRSDAVAEGADFPTNSSGHSTNRSIPTTSSGGSESKNFIPPQNVSHIIGDQVGSMYLDRQRNIWIKNRRVHRPTSARNILPSEDSENDPFADIPDLSVDLTREMQNLRLATARKEEAAVDPIDVASPSSPTRTPKAQSSRGYVTLSPDGTVGQNLTSPAREELRKLGEKSASKGTNQEEEVEHEITLHEDRVDNSSPSRKRNLTISFSSPIASVIQDVVPEDIEGLDDDTNVLGEVPLAPVRESDRYQSLKKGSKGLFQHRARSTSRGASRQLSVAGREFVPRPVSRIDEQDEDGASTPNRNRERQVSIVGDQTVVSHRTPNTRAASLSFVVHATPGAAARAAVHPEAGAILAQNIGNLSLSPLSDFTLAQADQSFGFEVSYIVGNRHLMTGDGSKRVMSLTVRDLVDRLTEVEPFEPYWEDLAELDLQDRRLTSLHMLDEFCGRLVTLDASNNALAHLDGVPTTVRELKVTYNMLTELTSWDHLANLQYVDVSNNELRSLSALKNLVHLRSLKADGNLLTDLDDIIDTHAGLLCLRVRDNMIERVDFEGTALQRLVELDLSGNRISSVRNVGHLSNLETLKLQRNNLPSFVVDMDGSKWTTLRYLDLSDNDLPTLDISCMPGLRLLHADRNRITKITGFTKTRHLDSLSLREQRLGQQPGEGPQLDLSFLAAAYEIRKLFLSGNFLGAFEPKVDFLNLQFLELANCGLKALPERMGQLMPNLRTLNINFNAISDLTPLQFIPRMKRLLVAGNRIVDERTATELLVEFPHLTVLDLRDNPITLGFYPHVVQRLLPNMQGAVSAKGSQSSTDMTTVKKRASLGTSTVAITNADDAAGMAANPAVDPFILPDGDTQRDEIFASRLDETTRLRRRLHQIVFVACCRRLKTLDGLPVQRGVVLVHDEMLRSLVQDGLLPPELVEREEVGKASRGAHGGGTLVG